MEPRADEAEATARLSRVRRHAVVAVRVLPLVGLCAWAVHGRAPTIPGGRSDARVSLARALEREGLAVDPEDVAWIDTPAGLGDTIRGASRAVVRARATGEPYRDIYLVRARRSPEGAVVSVASVHPLTKTSTADEGRPLVQGEWVAFTTTAANGLTGLDLYNLATEDVRAMEGWKRLHRLQNSVANWQRYGHATGVERRHYVVDPPAQQATLAWNGDVVVLEADGHRITVDRTKDNPVEGETFARFERVVKAKPSDIIQWTVDRVRAISWLGPVFIEHLEYRAFKFRDFLKRKFPAMFAEDAAKEVKADLGEAKIKPTFTDPEIGWPPSPMKPLLSPPLENEGVWLSTEDDPFVGKNPGVPAAFVQSFVRTDPQRSYARVYVTLWDPRQVSLHMVAGTVEPQSATGEVGTGQIPRAPEVLRSLVAGFNGGFQAIHFEGGMQANGTLYLPPKPYAGTIAELRDGSTAVGVWPADKPDVPDDILSFRQNLVPIVVDDVINPYKLQKWGGTPPGSADNIHTTRSGVCLTKDGFVGYFFGNDMTPETLGKGMVAANCKVAVHLDMNAGHTGFEFYRVAQTGELPDLMRSLSSDWEAENAVPMLPGWSFRARRMIKGMPHMLFPRYIGRDGRDFMYLTLRSVLPGHPILPRITPAEPDEGAWRVKGLPQHGFPYALALTKVRPDSKQPALRARVMKIDPRTVKLLAGKDESKAVVSFGTDAKAAPVKGAPQVWLATGSFALGATSPGPTAVPLFAAAAPTDAALAEATVVLGVADDDGTLVVAISDKPAGPALKALVQSLGCAQVVVGPKGLDLRLGTGLDLDGELAPKPMSGTVVTLERAAAPAAQQLFGGTPVVDPAIWAPLQAKRVRYGKKPAPPAPSASGK